MPRSYTKAEGEDDWNDYIDLFSNLHIYSVAYVSPIQINKTINILENHTESYIYIYNYYVLMKMKYNKETVSGLGFKTSSPAPTGPFFQQRPAS